MRGERNIGQCALPGPRLGALLTVTAVSGLPRSRQRHSLSFGTTWAPARRSCRSVVAVTNDPVLLFYNPASLGTLTSAAGSAGFFKHLLDINVGYAVYGQEIAGVGNVGAGVIYTNYGSFDRTDEFGNTIGTFTARTLPSRQGTVIRSKRTSSTAEP